MLGWIQDKLLYGIRGLLIGLSISAVMVLAATLMFTNLFESSPENVKNIIPMMYQGNLAIIAFGTISTIATIWIKDYKRRYLPNWLFR